MTFKGVVFLASCALLAGCATLPQFPEPDRTWQTYSGQLQYVTTGSRVIGEFEVSQKGGDFRLVFTKGGSVPLIRVSRHQQIGAAEGALARGQWKGRAADAPKALQGWLNEVPRGFSSLGPIMLAAQNATTTSDQSGSNNPRRMEVQGVLPGERFVFVFQQ